MSKTMYVDYEGVAVECTILKKINDVSTLAETETGKHVIKPHDEFFSTRKECEACILESGNHNSPLVKEANAPAKSNGKTNRKSKSKSRRKSKR